MTTPRVFSKKSISVDDEELKDEPGIEEKEESESEKNTRKMKPKAVKER